MTTDDPNHEHRDELVASAIRSLDMPSDDTAFFTELAVLLALLPAADDAAGRRPLTRLKLSRVLLGAAFVVGVIAVAFALTGGSRAGGLVIHSGAACKPGIFFRGVRYHPLQGEFAIRVGKTLERLSSACLKSAPVLLQIRGVPPGVGIAVHATHGSLARSRPRVYLAAGYRWQQVPQLRDGVRTHP